MSQQKVDKYKEDKANRTQIMKKQKRVRKIETIVIVAAVAAALVWFGVSVYNSNQATESAGVVYIDSKDVVDYMNDPEAATKVQAEEETEAETEQAVEDAVTEGTDVEEAVIDATLDTDGE